MSVVEARSGAVASAQRRVALIAERLRLTVSGCSLLAASLAALTCSLLVMVWVSREVIIGKGLVLWDHSTLSAVVGHRSSLLVSLARFVTNDFGSFKALVLLAIVAGGLLWWRGARLVLAMAPLVSLGVTAVLVWLTKLAVNRVRPPLEWRLVAEADSSFPSGHSSDSAAFYLVLAVVVGVVLLRRPLARVLAVASALTMEGAVGLSRLELGVHWPSDVIAGWALGTAVALVVSIVMVLASRIDFVKPQRTGKGFAGSAVWRVGRLLRARRPAAARIGPR